MKYPKNNEMKRMAISQLLLSGSYGDDIAFAKQLNDQIIIVNIPIELDVTILLYP